MKKVFLLSILITLAIATLAFAAVGELAVDGLGIRMQAFAPNPKKEANLTAVKATKDMRNDIQWSAYCAGAAIYRTMSTTTVTGTGKVIPATTWYTRAVDRTNGGYTNFSGCVGKLERQ